MRVQFVVLVAAAVGCSSAPIHSVSDAGAADSGAADSGSTDGGSLDAGVRDAGTADAGSADAGVDAGIPDAGVLDAGVADAGPLSTVVPTNLPNWTFYTPQMGGPNAVFGASFDRGGNLWVAGGEQGLYVMLAGTSVFQQFTMTDGLHPYGTMADGTDAPGPKYLSVISVSGGQAGIAYVGYAGNPPAAGVVDCESNWDGPNPDPSIYKSGDADKVTLTKTGISVIHYDIFSGPGLVPAELRGREKLCTIDRILYDPANDSVWFGANHGFAWGDPEYSGPAKCQWDATTTPPTPTSVTDPYSNEYGHEGCSGVVEHVHPAINGYADNTTSSCCVYLTDDYFGVSTDPVTNDVWFGGLIRTTKFHYGITNHDYYASESQTEDAPYISNRIDVWPDQVEEPAIPMPDQRVDDAISGAAAMPDGTVWLSSFAWGMAHLGADGVVDARVSEADGLVRNKLGAIAYDPLDGSVWAGAHWEGGIARLQGGTFTTYGGSVFGDALTNEGIVDIQASPNGPRRMVVSWSGDATHGGVVGVYSGP